MKKEIINNEEVKVGKLFCWVNGNQPTLRDNYGLFNGPDAPHKSFARVATWELFMVLQVETTRPDCFALKILKQDGLVGWLLVSHRHRLFELESAADIDNPTDFLP